MLDCDLAEAYGVETKVLKQAVKRNLQRFPSDFMFELTRAEFENLRSQSVTSSSEDSFRAHGGSRYMPFAFTESGVAMLSSVLHTPRAIQVNIEIVAAFVRLRKQPRANFGSIENKLDLILQKLDGIPKLEVQIPPSPHFSKGEANNSVSRIQQIVAQHWGLSIEDLQSSTRTKSVSYPRQIAIYLIRNHVQISFSEIGMHFGRRDHTTVLYAYRKIDAACDLNNKVQQTISRLKNKIEPQGWASLLQAN